MVNGDRNVTELMLHYWTNGLGQGSYNTRENNITSVKYHMVFCGDGQPLKSGNIVRYCSSDCSL